MKAIVFSILLGGCLAPAVQAQNYVSKVWVADQGNGTYKNPVLYADYSDPDVCRVGDDFYLTSSSFGCLPGLQILHSKDLVNWTIVGLPYRSRWLRIPIRLLSTAIVYGLRASVTTTTSSIFSGVIPIRVSS